MPEEVLSKAHEAALIKKLEAETEALREDILLKKAEVRQKAAHALAAEYGAESMRVQTESTLRQERLSKASNHLHHVYHFWDGVSANSVENCVVQLAAWDRLDAKCPMNIIMDSPGGSVIDGMHLFDEISGYSKRGGGKHLVTMTVRGYAASMGGILLQSADVRVIGRESYLMIHELSTYAQGKIGELKDEIKFLDRISDRVANIFVERSQGNISLEEFKKGWNRTDWWLDSEQALAHGFVDRVG